MSGCDRTDDAMAPPSLRERNRANKLKRIRDAARDRFSSQGYEATSTREIAACAHVGLATLFIYAENKRDLLFLAFSDDLNRLAVAPFADVDRDAPLLSQFVDVFAAFFRYYAQNRMLARDLLREISVYTSGRQRDKFHSTRELTISGLEPLIATARRRGQIASRADDAAIAHLVFDIFTSSLRRWLGGDDVPIATGLSDLRGQLVILFEGLRGGDHDPENASTGLTKNDRDP